MASDAGHVHTIQTADSPSNGKPIRGGGTWIVNKPSGYYLGRTMAGETFDDEETSPKNWHFGRAENINMCGWALPGSMGAKVNDVADSCSNTTKEQLKHRTHVGKDYNEAAHATGDGTAVAANSNCTLYFNYFNGTDFPSNGGHWANPAGASSASVMYRFTTRDGGAVVVRDPTLGWGFLATSCVTRLAKLHNDDDVP